MKQQNPREGLIELVQLRDTAQPLAAAGQPDAAAPQAAADPAPGVVARGRAVSLHFELALENGAIVDSCYGRAEPARCVIGDGTLLPGFEQALLGLRSGESCELLLPPEQAFGQPSPGNIQRFPRYRFPPDLELKEGLMVDFADSGGYSQAGVVLECSSQWVRVDFNHPLAGRSIRFRASIVDVQPAVLPQ